MSRVIYDPSLPSNQQTLGTHVGILSGIEGDFVTPSRRVDRYHALSLREVSKVPFTPDYVASGAADNFGDVLDGLAGFGSSGFGATPSSEVSAFLNAVNASASDLVATARFFGERTRQGNPPPQKLKDAYWDTKARLLNLIRNFHEDNPRLGRDVIRIPAEFGPPPSWSMWATIVPSSSGSVSGFGDFGVIPLIPIAIIAVAGAVSAAVITLSPKSWAEAQEIRARSQIIKAAADRAQAGDTMGAERLLKNLPDLPPKFSLGALFGLRGFAARAVDVAVVGGVGYVLLRRFAPKLVGVAARRTRRR